MIASRILFNIIAPALAGNAEVQDHLTSSSCAMRIRAVEGFRSTGSEFAMRRVILAMVAAVSASAVAYADILPATADYLRQIGIDPNSPGVRAVANDRVTTDSVKDVSLNSLAAEKNEQAIKIFIGTRSFYHEVRANPNAPLRTPKAEVYDSKRYMTVNEREFVGKIFLDHLMKSAK